MTIEQWERVRKVEVGNETTMRGVAHGKPPILWAINRKFLVLKIPGYSHWAGNYMPRSYKGTTFNVFKRQPEHDNDNTYAVDSVSGVIEIPVKLTADK